MCTTAHITIIIYFRRVNCFYIFAVLFFRWFSDSWSISLLNCCIYLIVKSSSFSIHSGYTFAICGFLATFTLLFFFRFKKENMSDITILTSGFMLMALACAVLTFFIKYVLQLIFKSSFFYNLINVSFLSLFYPIFWLNICLFINICRYKYISFYNNSKPMGEFQTYFSTILLYVIVYPLCHTALLGAISKVNDKEPQGFLMVSVSIVVLMRIYYIYIHIYTYMYIYINIYICI
jgi:hypothetical protein